MTLQRTGNIALGLTIINVGIFTVIRLNSISGFMDMLRICVFACNLFMGILLLIRRKVGFELTPFYKPYWLGMIICNIIIFKYSNDLPIISLPSLILLLGVCWTIFSLCSLGREFGLFPASSTIVTRGTYKIVRHPIYLGESFMVISCFLSNIGWLNFFVLIIFIVFLCMRINLEEQVIAKKIEYSDYQKKVEWKLVPCIW
jgi:protein-S-isoprenylcysteine O-methyltransferase Ste14